MGNDRTQDLEQQRDRGIKAQQFLESIRREGYFEKLVAEIDAEITAVIAGLDPLNTAAFTVFQAQRQALYAPLARVEADINAGKHASDILNGTPVKGIL